MMFVHLKKALHTIDNEIPLKKAEEV